jgi:hypothetical protein
MSQGIPTGHNEPIRSTDEFRKLDVGSETDVKHLLEAGRQVLRQNPRLTEAEFRSLMLERFRAGDQGLQRDKAGMTASPGHGAADGVFAVFLLPWTIFRWLGWRGRLTRHHAEMGEVVGVLRGEGYFTSTLT